jgi:hypothetical protein
MRKSKVDWFIDWLVCNAKFNNSKSKDRQYNVQKKKDKMTLTKEKTKYRATWISLKMEVKSGASEG